MLQKGYFDINFKSISSTDEYIDIQGLASTVYKDRDGDVVSPVGIDLTNYRKNPIVLFNHDWHKPIGRTLETKITNEGLFVKVRVFKDTNPEVFTAVKNGVLSTFSIGFIGKQGKYDNETDTYYFTEIELYEISIVSIPSNQDAIFEVVKSPDCEKGACKLKNFKKDNVNKIELQEIKQLLQEVKQLLIKNDKENKVEEEIQDENIEIRTSDNVNESEVSSEKEDEVDVNQTKPNLDELINSLSLSDKLNLYFRLEDEINQNLN